MKFRAALFLTLGLTLGNACKCGGGGAAVPVAVNPQDYYIAEPIHLMVPKAPGWQPDTASNTNPTEADKGGTVLRLVRESAVVGSPRMDVVLEPQPAQPTQVEEFLSRNLQEMGKLESSGQIHIIQVEQKRVLLGSHAAYRVHHEYTVGSGNGQAAINQVSTFVVLGGRGVAITVAGRTELFHPLAESVEHMLDGLRIQNEGAAVMPDKNTPAVDLGKVGGRGKPGK